MDLIESRSLQAKCVINLMTLISKNHLAMLQQVDILKKAYETGCLVGMLEGEVFQTRVNSQSVISDLPFSGEVLEQFVTGVTVVVQQLLVDKNKEQLAADQQRLQKIRQEVQTSVHHTQNLLANVDQLEQALVKSQLFGDEDQVLDEFRDRVDMMRSMGHIKSQESQVLDKLIEQNSILIERTDQSLNQLPDKARKIKQLVQNEMRLLEASNGDFNTLDADHASAQEDRSNQEQEEVSFQHRETETQV